ncbi:hypothetical protein [Rhodanobacter lindaniclasticus]
MVGFEQGDGSTTAALQQKDASKIKWPSIWPKPADGRGNRSRWRATSPAGPVGPRLVIGPADAWVLTLPLAHGDRGMALLAFIGGFSAATGMVIVAAVALSTMISNDLVMPALLRIRALRLEQRSDLSQWVLGVRRQSSAWR